MTPFTRKKRNRAAIEIAKDKPGKRKNGTCLEEPIQKATERRCHLPEDRKSIVKENHGKDPEHLND